MIIKNLILELQKHPGINFQTGVMINEYTVDWNWGSNSTADEVIEMLLPLSKDETLMVDIEDGFIYRKVIGVELKYYSPTENRLDFMTV